MTLALAGLALQIWELVTTMPGWPRVDRAFPILRLAILACGIAAAAGIAGRGRVARGAVPFLVLVQLADPAASVVPVQLCAEPPVPRVRVTVLPGRAIPKEVRTPAKVAGWALVAVVAPV